MSPRVFWGIVGAILAVLVLGLFAWNLHQRQVRDEYLSPAEELAKATGLDYGPVQTPEQQRVARFCEAFLGGRQVTATNELLSGNVIGLDPELERLANEYKYAEWNDDGPKEAIDSYCQSH